MVYTKERMALALDEIKQGYKVYTAAKKHNVPESTLRSEIKEKYSNKSPGPTPILTTSVKNKLVEWILQRSINGIPVTKGQLCCTVKMLCDTLNVKTPFPNNMPGDGWFKAFMRRNSQLANIVSEHVNFNRGKVSEEELRSWYQRQISYLQSKDLKKISPTRINCDETGMWEPSKSTDIAF